MIQEGIYLEEKKTILGAAGTAREVVFRNLWATREVALDCAVLQLLDEKGQPTIICEKVTEEELGQRFVFRPVKPETWSAVKKKIEAVIVCQEQVPSPKPARKPTKPQTPPKGTSWWDI